MVAAITDFSHFAGLRAGAQQNDPAVLREVAGQFEALFIETMLKNMRDASLGDAILGNSDQHEMYEGMLDQQMALEMASGKGFGLADMLVRQLGGETDTSNGVSGGLRLPAAVTAVADKLEPFWADAKSFAADVWPHAVRAAKRLNVAPEAVLAQAALESGWGAHVPNRADGTSSFNLFGIKAGAGWSGATAVKPTVEFAAGAARSQLARFRAYHDVAENFDDYSDLLSRNPRYASVNGHGNSVAGFAEALQASGYATDPSYADKIKDIVRSSTMQSVLQGVKNLAPASAVSTAGKASIGSN